MAMRGYIYGKKAVIKESGGRPFLSSAVKWTDNPSAMPEKVEERTKEFKKAVKECRGKSKSKGGTVWGVSEYNKCIRNKLKKLSKTI